MLNPLRRDRLSPARRPGSRPHSMIPSEPSRLAVRVRVARRPWIPHHSLTRLRTLSLNRSGSDVDRESRVTHQAGASATSQTHREQLRATGDRARQSCGFIVLPRSMSIPAQLWVGLSCLWRYARGSGIVPRRSRESTRSQRRAFRRWSIMAGGSLCCDRVSSRSRLDQATCIRPVVWFHDIMGRD